MLKGVFGEWGAEASSCPGLPLLCGARDLMQITLLIATVHRARGWWLWELQPGTPGSGLALAGLSGLDS